MSNVEEMLNVWTSHLEELIDKLEKIIANVTFISIINKIALLQKDEVLEVENSILEIFNINIKHFNNIFNEIFDTNITFNNISEIVNYYTFKYNTKVSYIYNNNSEKNSDEQNLIKLYLLVTFYNEMIYDHELYDTFIFIYDTFNKYFKTYNVKYIRIFCFSILLCFKYNLYNFSTINPNEKIKRIKGFSFNGLIDIIPIVNNNIMIPYTHFFLNDKTLLEKKDKEFSMMCKLINKFKINRLSYNILYSRYMLDYKNIHLYPNLNIDSLKNQLLVKKGSPYYAIFKNDKYVNFAAFFKVHRKEYDTLEFTTVNGVTIINETNIVKDTEYSNDDYYLLKLIDSVNISNW